MNRRVVQAATLGIFIAAGTSACLGNRNPDKLKMRCKDTYPDLDEDEVLLELDQTGDGSLTEADLNLGESVVVFRFTQANGKVRITVSRDDDPQLLMCLAVADGMPYEWGDHSLFGTWHEMRECSADGWITHWFFNEDEEAVLPQTGIGDLYDLAFDIAEIEHGDTNVGQNLDGHIHLVVDDDGATGHLEGTVSADIISHASQGLTGEHAEILAHAFRGLPLVDETPCWY